MDVLSTPWRWSGITRSCSATARARPLKVRFEGSDPKADEGYYYVRVWQKDGQMAWSRPIWVRR